MYPSVKALEDEKRQEKKQKKETSSTASTGDKGRLQPVASFILMGLLYAARYARFDLLRAINHLACHITRWNSACDKRLHRLMNYVHSSLQLRMVGWIGDKLDNIEPHLFADADFSGCTFTQRSTTGLHLVLRGPNSSFPIAGASKRQGCVSQSTPEAELVATSYSLRHHGLPAITLFETLLQRRVYLQVHEDNTAMIQCVKTGKNPTMRYLHRTHRVSVGWLHEAFRDDHLDLVYEMTARMCADIYTKAFTDQVKSCCGPLGEGTTREVRVCEQVWLYVVQPVANPTHHT